MDERPDPRPEHRSVTLCRQHRLLALPEAAREELFAGVDAMFDELREAYPEAFIGADPRR